MYNTYKFFRGGEKGMKYIKKVIILFVIISVIFNIETVFANEKDIKKDIAQFYYSVMNESGYITCAIDITEKQNNTFKLDIVFKENINGINLGFYISPYILQFMELTDMKYDSAFEGSYLYTIGSGEYDSLEQLSSILSRLPFITMEGDGREFYAEFDLTVWDDIRKKDNFIDDIYKTNYFIFSYKPLKHMDTNATRFKEGTYIWQLEDGKLTGIYALNNKSYAGLIVAIIGIIVFVSGIYIILKNPFNKRKKVRKNKRYNYDNYGYQDDDYYYY